MAFTGVLGGVVNYYSDFNKDLEDKTKKLRNCMVCIFLGIAATIIMPLFLKLADSQLVVNIENDIFTHHKNDPKTQTERTGYQTPAAETKPNTQTGTGSDISGTLGQGFQKSDNKSVASDYLLWAAYCLLAAAAGMRFIDLLVNKLLTQAQVIELQKKVEKKKEENKELAKEKENLEGTVEKIAKTEEKRMKNYEVSEQNLIKQLNNSSSETDKVDVRASFNEEKLPDLPHVKFTDDPQKGRFGGQSSSNGRTLSVSYKKYFLPGFLKLTIKVSADHENNLLKGNVYLFLHDSFADSVAVYDAEGKKEVVHEVISYGAFTIGAVTDKGNTMLELDIAEQKDFPEDFRNR